MPISEAQDFLDETRSLHGLIAGLDNDALLRPTAFKAWSIERIIGHLHFWNRAALLSVSNEAGFVALIDDVRSRIAAGGMAAIEAGGLGGPALVASWLNFAEELAEAVGPREAADRVKWVGPDMSVRSSITARLMETWAHGQAAFDALGAERINHDSIRGIAVLGVNTYGWTYAVRGMPAPDPKPFVKLTAPSGTIWRFGEEQTDERIEGLAEEFCQVVTQTRNFADTSLRVTGANAADWMARAQCFAGPPETPPAPGTRATLKL
jgi:uncharacterized protein (TIGR03084 family)